MCVEEMNESDCWSGLEFACGHLVSTILCISQQNMCVCLAFKFVRKPKISRDLEISEWRKQFKSLKFWKTVNRAFRHGYAYHVHPKQTCNLWLWPPSMDMLLWCFQGYGRVQTQIVYIFLAQICVYRFFDQHIFKIKFLKYTHKNEFLRREWISLWRKIKLIYM